MPSRFRNYGLLIGSLLIAGCGGAAETPKTPAVDTKTANAAEPKKPEETAVKSDKPVEPAAKPKDPFALPNVEFASSEDRKKITFAGKELSVEACMWDNSGLEIKHQWFTQAIRDFVVGPDGGIYILDHDYKIRRYVAQPGDTCKLALDINFAEKGILTLPTEADRIAVADDAAVYALDAIATYRYKDGKVEKIDCDVKTVNADGKTGFRKRGDQIIAIEVSAECKETPWKPTGWPTPKKEKGQKEAPTYDVNDLHQWGKDVMVHMTLGGQHYIGIHGPDGKLKVKFGKNRDKDKDAKDGEDICWTADSDQCTAGVCLLDSNCKRLTAWDPAGKYVESVSLSDLLGIFSPWPVALVTTPKGFSYMAVTQEEKKPDGAPDDKRGLYVGLVYKIKGLN